jgi:hypothetical protein
MYSLFKILSIKSILIKIIINIKAKTILFEDISKVMRINKIERNCIEEERISRSCNFFMPLGLSLKVSIP